MKTASAKQARRLPHRRESGARAFNPKGDGCEQHFVALGAVWSLRTILGRTWKVGMRCDAGWQGEWTHGTRWGTRAADVIGVGVNPGGGVLVRVVPDGWPHSFDAEVNDLALHGSIIMGSDSSGLTEFADAFKTDYLASVIKHGTNEQLRYAAIDVLQKRGQEGSR